MGKKAVQKDPRMLEYVPDNFKMQEMCNEALRRGPWHLRHVLDWFMTQQQLKLWHDDYIGTTMMSSMRPIKNERLRNHKLKKS